MNRRSIVSITRRQLTQMLGAGAAGVALGSFPALEALAQSRKDTLVIGIDTSDTNSLDPARDLHYTPPMTISACYEALVTMAPDQYVDLKPALAKSWARTPDGKGWRFNLRENVKFVSGNPLTADDVKFSFDRIRNIRTQAHQYITNIVSVDIVDDKTVDFVLKDPAEPFLTIIAAPSFSIVDRKEVQARGGVSTPDASTADKATEWLNQNSAGTGAYKLTKWERNSGIQLVANPTYWGGPPPFRRVLVRHFEDGAAQLLAIKRGDIDIAFNLLPEQIETLRAEPEVTIARATSLDFIYLGLTSGKDLNEALANKKARQAVGYAIDYEGMRKSLLGGSATRPTSFIPVGLVGSSEDTTKEFGFREDLDRSRKLLAEAGLSDGFEFEVTYGNGAIAGSSYHVLAQKLQSDLARVGIRLKLRPLPQVNVRTLYNGGKVQAVLTYWNPPAVENALWGAATVERVAKRLHWTPPQELVTLVRQASIETDRAKQAELWTKYQAAMVDEGHLIVLAQPIYQIGVRKSLKSIPLTGAGWQLDIKDVKPAV